MSLEFNPMRPLACPVVFHVSSPRGMQRPNEATGLPSGVSPSAREREAPLGKPVAS